MHTLLHKDPFESHIIEYMFDGMTSKDHVERRLVSIMSDIAVEENEDLKGKALSRMMMLYVLWNTKFAPQVIRLASFAQTVISDQGYPETGARVASRLFNSTIHEYGEKFGDRVYTHAELSNIFITYLNQKIWKGTIPPSTYLNRPPKILKLLKKVEMGYMGDYDSNEINYSKISIDQLCQGIGFHVASEGLASMEFATLDKCMQMSGLYEYYEAMQYSSELADGISPYHWLEVHGEVEKEHFIDAVECYRIVAQDLSKISHDPFILGYKKFCEMQSIMINLLEDEVMAVLKGELEMKPESE